jgi:hypothetical protein
MNHPPCKLIALLLTTLTGLNLGGDKAVEDFKLEEGFVALFNGKDLSGWEYGSVPPAKNPMPREKLEDKTQSSDGVFSVKDGLLIANGKKVRALYTAKEFNKDFRVKFEFRASADKPKDNSGLFIRGPQLQLDATNEKGSLTGVFRNVKTFHVGGWNEIDVTVKGTEATCLCNGEPIMKKPMKIPEKGAIGLQSEYGQFEFRRIRIQELP